MKKSIKINALLNIIRQSLSVIFPLITYPYISRILGAGNVGRYSFSDSIIQTLITVSLLGIPTYAVREGAMIRGDKKEIEQFCSEVFTINFISSFFSYMLLLIMVLAVERIRIEMAFVLILSINIISKCMGRDWLNSIYEEYLYISLRYVGVRILSLLLIFLLVKNENDLTKYVSIMAFSELGGNILNVYFTEKKVPYRFCFSKSLMHHVKPLLILFCSSIASTIYIRSDITILGFLCSDKEVGIYTMSSKIYSIVKNVLNAIITVTIPRLAFYLGSKDENAIQKYNDLLNSIRNNLILILFPAAVGLFCLSQDVMCILGGSEFVSGSVSLKIFSFSLLFAVLACFYAHAVLIVNRQDKVFLKATIISALVNIILNLIFIPRMGINGAAMTTVLSEICIVIICAYTAKRFYSEDQSKLYKTLFTVLAECLIIVIVTYVSKIVIHNTPFRLFLSIIISMFFYGLLLIITKNDIIKGFHHIEKKKS